MFATWFCSVRAGALKHVLGKPADHPEGTLQRVPAGDLHQHGSARVQRLVLDQFGAAVDAKRGGILSTECGVLLLPSVGEEPAGAQHREHRRAIEILVLGREHVDRGRDHEDALATEALTVKRLAREHERVRLQEIGGGNPTPPGPARWGGRGRRGSASCRSAVVRVMTASRLPARLAPRPARRTRPRCR